MRLIRLSASAVRGLCMAAFAAISAAGCGGGSCDCDTADDAAAAPKVTSLDAGLGDIQVIPPISISAPPRAFQLTAWYRDADGHVVSGRFNPMKWSFDPAAEGIADRGRIQISTFPTGSPGAKVRVEKDDDPSISDEVTITRWSDASAAAVKGDVVTAEHTPGMPPAAVLLEEREGATCGWGAVRAFVGAAQVGELNNDPCSLSLFSADHAMFFASSTGPWGITGSKHPITLAPRPAMKIRVFIAVTGRTASVLSGIPLSNSAQLATDVSDAAMAQAITDVDWVKLTWEASRVGVTIDAQYTRLDPTTPNLAEMVGAQPYDCFKPSNMSASQKNSADPSFAYDPTVVSVYYVDWIDYPTDPLHPGSRGVTCPHIGGETPTSGPVVYVSYTRHSSVTLAHELGHALGLNDEETLGETNLMFSTAPDGPLGADARSRLTVGQAFRMNVWNSSWFGLTRPDRRYCDAAQPCPPMTTDAK